MLEKALFKILFFQSVAVRNWQTAPFTSPSACKDILILPQFGTMASAFLSRFL
nr:MAG: hypothetical protein [Bacteriophage sp.]